MNIDRHLIGKSSSPQTFLIQREDVVRFMDATGDPALPALQQSPLLYASPTFPVTFALYFPGLNLDGSGMQLLHREQTFNYTRRLRIDEAVTCTMQIEDIRERVIRGDSMTFIIQTTTGIDSEQQPVFTIHTTLVVRQNVHGG